MQIIIQPTILGEGGGVVVFGGQCNFDEIPVECRWMVGCRRNVDEISVDFDPIPATGTSIKN